MGNWPSVLSDEGSDVHSESDVRSDNESDSWTSCDQKEEEFCSSDKSFFSEDELLPVIDTDEDDDAAPLGELLNTSTPNILSVGEDGEFSTDNIDRYDPASEYHSLYLREDVCARFLNHDSAQEREIPYSSTDDNDEEDNDVEEEDDVDEEDGQDYHKTKIALCPEMKDDHDDDFSSIPLPPPSSPYEATSLEQMQRVTACLNADQQETVVKETIVPSVSCREEYHAPGRVVAWEIDVSDMAGTKKASKKRAPKKLTKVKSKSDPSAESVYIPPTVSTTPELLAQRKWLDQKRWFCMSRPQYSKSCGLSSLVSCWNYLFSTLGGGTMPPITQEQALVVLGFQPPFGEIRFGPFTGNATLMRWFKKLNDHYGVRGRAYIQYKPHGRGRTIGRTSDEGLHLLQQGLKDSNMAFIYHCHNHYFCPIGYENVPLKAVDAYRDPLRSNEVETWILIGDPSRKHPGIHCFKWEDVSTDLNCQSPDYLNIRKLHLGVQQRRTKRTGGNLHCIMAFCRSAGFLTRPVKSKKGGASKDTSRKSKSNDEAGFVAMPGRKVGQSKSEEVMRSETLGGNVSCSQNGKADSSDVSKHVSSDNAGHVRLRSSEVKSRRSEVIGRTQRKGKVRRQGAKASDVKQEEIDVKSSDTNKKVFRNKKSKKQKTSKGLSAKRNESNPPCLFDAEISEDQVDLTLPLATEDTGVGHRQALNEEMDEVDRFIKNVSTCFNQSLSPSDHADVAALKEVMSKSENTRRVDTQDDWVLLGQTNQKGKDTNRLTSPGKTVMGLSNFRGMGVDDDDLANVDDLQGEQEADGQVSELAKHLIDRYLVSIIDSIDKQKCHLTCNAGDN
ncbi:uncharacterized protein LOC129279628 [Lytechinus pictus]|uniref:uncharacterized protein LOC129279628 n=1 Tax=Lytechinus pictus TaxID=7653 RepID=UPI0030BA05D3